MKQKFVLFMMLLCSLASMRTFAADKAEYVPYKVNDQVYLFTQIWHGSDNNINFGIVIGDDGVLLINSMMAYHADALVAEVEKITDKPIKFVINSDSDPYNHHSNRYFADRGATIFSQQNFKYVNGYSQVLFSDKLTLPMGMETMVAYHTPAHTLNHVLIHLPKSNVIFLSDAFKPHWVAPTGPNGLKGYLAAVDMALALADDKTLILSGNTSKPPANYFTNKAGLLKARKIHIDFTQRIGELHKKGLDAKAITEDKKFIEIVSQLENYEVFKGHNESQIITMIDSDFTKPYALTAEQKRGYVGRYSSQDNGVLEIVLENDKLYTRQVGKFHFELTPLSKTKFDLKANRRSDHLVFEFDASGAVVAVSVKMEKKSWYRHVLPTGKRVKESRGQTR